MQVKRELDSVVLFPETKEVLKELRSKGIILVSISNLATPYKRPFYALGLDRLIDLHLFSCDLGIKKLDKKIFYQTVEHLGSKPDLMVGDSLYSDTIGARNAGISAIHLDRSEKTSGGIHTLNEIFKYLNI